MVTFTATRTWERKHTGRDGQRRRCKQGSTGSGGDEQRTFAEISSPDEYPANEDVRRTREDTTPMSSETTHYRREQARRHHEVMSAIRIMNRRNAPPEDDSGVSVLSRKENNKRVKGMR